MIDPTQVEAVWRRRGFTFGTWEDGPNSTWESLSHDYDELFMVADGEMELTIGEKRFRPRLGEVVFIPAGSLRSKRCLSPAGVIWYYGYRK